jgi:hypothetical protein
LFVDASGNVATGVAAFTKSFTINASDAALALQMSSVGDYADKGIFFYVDSTPYSQIYNSGGGNLVFRTGSGLNERMRLDSNGRLGLGTSSPDGPLHVFRASAGTVTANGNADEFVVENSSNGGISILTPDASHGYLIFGSPSDNEGAMIRYRHVDKIYTISTEATGGSILFRTGAGTSAVTIDSSQRVGIGDTAPDALLTVNGVGSFGAGSASAPSIAARGDLNTGIFFPAADTIAFAEGGSEAARLDSSGRLLVGTSTARGNFYNGSFSSALQLEGTDTNRRLSITGADEASVVILARQKSGSAGGNTILADGDSIGVVTFQGNDGSEFVEAATIAAQVDGTPGADDMPGRLVFSTTLDGASTPTERLRITSAGVLQVADAGNITVGTTTGTKIGTATTQKIGFYNATPVVQPAAVADATTAVDVITQLNDLLAKLRTLGIIAT